MSHSPRRLRGEVNDAVIIIDGDKLSYRRPPRRRVWIIGTLCGLGIRIVTVTRVGSAVRADVSKLTIAADSDLILRNASDLDQCRFLDDAFETGVPDVAERLWH